MAFATSDAAGLQKATVYYPHCYAEIEALFEDERAQFDASKASTLQILPFTVEPISCSVHLNSVKEADTFTLTFKMADCPVPLHALKNGGVRIFMLQTDSLSIDGSALKTALQTADANNDNSSRLLLGIIDDVDFEVDAETGGAMFKVSGRDLAGLLLSRQWPTQKRAALKATLKDTIKELVDLGTGWLAYDDKGHIGPGPAQKNGSAGFSLGKRLDVVWLDGTGNWVDIDQLKKETADENAQNLFQPPPELPDSFKARGKKTPKNPPKNPVGSHEGLQRNNKSGKPVPRGDNYWAVISSICAQKGYYVFVRGDKVIIADPQTLILTSKNTREHFFGVGYNIKKYNFSKKLNKESVPQIKVYWYDNIHKKNHFEVFPPDGKQIWNGIAVEQTKQIEVPAPWCNSAKAAQTVAQLYYNDISRQQSNIIIETHDLKEATNKDLLKLRVGYPVVVLFADPWQDQFENKSQGEIYDVITGQKLTAELAETVAQLWDTIKHWQGEDYYTKEVTYDWHIDSGISIAITLHNFINPNDDEVLKAAKGPQAGK